MDPRVERTQQLYWEVEAFRQKGVYPAALPQLLEMARLHEERARELLQAGDPAGWTDLFAAVTAWGEARRRIDADRVLTAGHGFAASLGPNKANVEKELRQLETWLNSLPPVPAVAAPDGAATMAEPVRE